MAVVKGAVNPTPSPAPAHVTTLQNLHKRAQEAMAAYEASEATTASLKVKATAFATALVQQQEADASLQMAMSL